MDKAEYAAQFDAKKHDAVDKVAEEASFLLLVDYGLANDKQARHTAGIVLSQVMDRSSLMLRECCFAMGMVGAYETALEKAWQEFGGSGSERSDADDGGSGPADRLPVAEGPSSQAAAATATYGYIDKGAQHRE